MCTHRGCAIFRQHNPEADDDDCMVEHCAETIMALITENDDLPMAEIMFAIRTCLIAGDRQYLLPVIQPTTLRWSSANPGNYSDRYWS
jgi:hypothetical protein